MSGSKESRQSPAIVVGVDGSNGSSEALRWAIAEARLRSVPVRAVHAWSYSQPVVPSLAGYPYTAESVGNAIDDRWQAEQRLEHATSELGEEHEIDRVVVEGSAAQVLIDAVGEADVLVVGSRGHGGFTNLLLGSVSQQCAQHAPCPVVIVRGEVIEMSTAQDRPRSDEVLHGGAVVVWSGDLKTGTGRLRFEYGAGGELALLWPGSDGYGPGATTPEELTAAAHAACFTMTLAHTLARNGHSTKKITAAARATFGIAEHVRVIRRSQLEITVQADGLGESELAQAAELAGRYCPVSNTLRAGGVELDVTAHLAAPMPVSG